MKRSVRLYVEDIRKNMELALQFIDGVDFQVFSTNERIHYAVVRCLEIIGEAARNIPETVREQYPLVPWRDMVGMRNKIAHGYFDVNFTIVWEVLIEDLPGILPDLHHVMQTLSEEYQ